MVTKGYKGLQRVTKGYKGLQGVTKGYRGLQGLTNGYKGLQGVRRGYKGLQGVTRVYKGLTLFRLEGGFSNPPPPRQNRDNSYTERAMTFKFSDFSLNLSRNILV